MAMKKGNWTNKQNHESAPIIDRSKDKIPRIFLLEYFIKSAPSNRAQRSTFRNKFLWKHKSFSFPFIRLSLPTGWNRLNERKINCIYDCITT